MRNQILDQEAVAPTSDSMPEPADSAEAGPVGSTAPTPAGPAVGLGGAWNQLVQLTSIVEHGLGEWLSGDYRIGLSDYRALKLLTEAPQKELRVNDVAAKTGLNQSSTTRLVGRLESKNLAYRDTCPDDGRGVYAVITGDGETLVREIAANYEATLRELLHTAADELAGASRAGIQHSVDRIARALNPDAIPGEASDEAPAPAE